MLTISGTEHPASARLTTAVPRVSWKVSPPIRTAPAFTAAAFASAKDDLKPSLVHGVPRLLRQMTSAGRAIASRRIRRLWVSGTVSRLPVLLWRSRIEAPSYCAQVMCSTSDCRGPVLMAIAKGRAT
ncbi:hypothetical protein CG50_03050 [Paenirhodobacter enshiensis]|uniref:Uncharacterized protein n=1 Tax=Paenirhodobacter enshiensis TaxID=1105367 RepID=A0A086Y8V6_9RHOB|nr:hypothetical protein CG50_03050 [Paenirhodobacter enshiensis]